MNLGILIQFAKAEPAMSLMVMGAFALMGYLSWITLKEWAHRRMRR